MFWAVILPIIRSIRLCNTAYGMLYPICCRWVIWWRRNCRHQITHWQRIGYNIP